MCAEGDGPLAAANLSRERKPAMDDTPFDKFREECGVFGIFGHPEAANMAYLGLYALQHRGQESAGIVSSDGTNLYVHKEMGLVNDIFDETRLAKLPGSMAIAHNRYSTTGSSMLKNAQPFVVEYARGPLAVAHNGNLVNAMVIKRQLEEAGSIFQSTMDSEIFVHLIAHSSATRMTDRIVEAVGRVKGSFSLLLMTEDTLYAVRDPHGFRPLSLGTLGNALVLASETCAFDLIGATHLRDVNPGELLVIDRHGIVSQQVFPPSRGAQCIFEYIYFSRPDSIIFGRTVHDVRRRMGRILSQETGVEADLVVPVPDSGVPAALGYAEAAGIPFDMGLIRNHYVGRTFIEPKQSIRHFGVKIKLNPVRSVIQGKRVVVVDDSIVRGTTSRKIIKMVRSAGAREVHLRICSPPTTHPCFYGIDTPTRSELIANSHTVEETRTYLTADSLAYLSFQGMLDSLGGGDCRFCTACFSGDYPVEFPPEPISQLRLFDTHDIKLVAP
jgi:amidophosphoribosyltransferase